MTDVSNILQLEETLLTSIDESVTHANDDELFAGGYLRGHISLAAADCELEGITDIADFLERVQEGINQAKSELTPADQLLVADMWAKLHASN